MQPKKSLGQNFLKSQKAINTIVNISNIKAGDTILEIGPGMGVLTKALLEAGGNVIAVEKDDLLIPILSEKFKGEILSGKLQLIHDDILYFDISKIYSGVYKLVANIPYYITGQIIRMFLETKNQPESMTILVQKEVADRIVAKDKKESLLSLSVKAYGEPKFVEKVPRGAFAPAPNVDSAVVYIGNISKKRFSNLKEKDFFTLIHEGFAHKRKQILPNLSALYGKEKVIKALGEVVVQQTARAEDINIDKWIELCATINA